MKEKNINKEMVFPKSFGGIDDVFFTKINALPKQNDTKKQASKIIQTPKKKPAVKKITHFGGLDEIFLQAKPIHLKMKEVNPSKVHLHTSKIKESKQKIPPEKKINHQNNFKDPIDYFGGLD